MVPMGERGGDGPTTAGDIGDAELVAALAAGDEAAFADLVTLLTPTLLRLAALYVPTRAVAEEVVQETWVAVVRGLPGFEGRSSLRTWVCRILLNRARSLGARERRSAAPAHDGSWTAPERGRFFPIGTWEAPPSRWDELPEERLMAAETIAHVDQAIAALPLRQRTVVELRDRQHWTAAEVSELLGLSDANQRVLLHRARRSVRASLEEYLR